MQHDLLRNLFIPALSGLLTQIPTLLVYLAGFVVALVSWRRHPRPSLLAAISCITMFVLSIAWQFAFYIAWYLRGSWGWTMEKFSVLQFTLNITVSILHAGALSLLLIAVYAGRNIASAAGKQAIPGVQKSAALPKLKF